MQSLLSAVLVILIIFVLLIIFVPAWLERRARDNIAARERHARDLQEQAKGARRLELALAPYARGRSAHFVTGVAAARERLAELNSLIDAAAGTLDSLRLPVVYRYLLPAQHFALVPRDAAAILSDAGRVRRLGGQMRAMGAATTAAEEALAALAALPQSLDDERRAVAARLTEIERALRTERRAGIEALDDLDATLNHLRELLARQQASSQGTPAALDEGAAALEEAETGVERLAATVAELGMARARLDERLQAVASQLDDAQAGAKATPSTLPVAVQRPLRRAAALLNESAADHRRRRDFAAAEADVAGAARLVALARDAAAAAERSRLLAERDDGISLTEPIADLRRELVELLDGLENRLGSAAREAALVARAADIRRRADALTTRQDEIIAGLARDAAATRERLSLGWEAARQLLPLAADDPLARRHAMLMAAADEARRSPAALEQYRRNVAEFEGELQPWVARVEAGRRRVAELRARLPEQIDSALALAAPWACLAGHTAFIQQRAADFETTQARLANARRRREVDPLLDELEAIEGDVAKRFAVLSDQAERLRFLEQDVNDILNMAAGDIEGLLPDDPALPRRDRSLKLIAHHTAQAHNAARYEDASLALSRAADLANRLAL